MFVQPFADEMNPDSKIVPSSTSINCNQGQDRDVNKVRYERYSEIFTNGEGRIPELTRTNHPLSRRQFNEIEVGRQAPPLALNHRQS